MNPYPSPYGMHPPPLGHAPYPMPMMPPLGTPMPPSNVMSAPPMMHPQMVAPNRMPMTFVPANWPQRAIATPATQPMTLYIGKISSELDNEFLVQLLERCGSVSKWNRPEDLAARKLKPFGFVTYTQGTAALRCRNVIHGLEICGETLQVKAGTKEQAALISIAAAEQNPPPTFDPYTRLPVPQQVVDTNAIYDAPLRELIHKLIEKRYNPNPSEGIDAEIAALETRIKGFIPQEPEDEDDPAFDRERQILREIERFREKQAKRDRELEQKRNERIVIKLREMEDGNYQPMREYTKLAASTVPIPKALPITPFPAPLPPAAAAPPPAYLKRELESEEDQEAKRRRRLQALAMINGGEVDYSAAPAPALPENSASSPSDPAADRGDDALANIAAGITNRAIGGKLILKSNAKPAKKSAGFGGDEEDSNDRSTRQLIPLDYTEEENRSLQYTHEQIAAQFLSKMEKSATAPAPQASPATAPLVGNSEAAKKQKLKEIVDTLPTSKYFPLSPSASASGGPALTVPVPYPRDGLFTYPIDWNACEKHNVIESSMRSWIGKKFMEYLGEEESSLTSFILKKISKRCHPEELLSELEPVLDKDTESFVLKLWRMLIFNVIKADIDGGGDGQGGGGGSSRWR